MLLSGIRVLDCTSMLAGPYCCMMLADLGAEVIKIEHPQVWDPGRDLGVLYGKSKDTSVFLGANRNKLGITLDLSKPRGQDVFYSLTKTADMVAINLRPDVSMRLGLDYDSLRAVKDNLIYCNFSAFGERMPYRTKPGTDTVIQAMSGIMYLTGEEGDPPVRIGTAIADISGSVYAAFGIMAALYHRSLTGEGQKVSISLLETLIGLQTPRVMDFFANGQNPVRTGNHSPYASPVYSFKTTDGYISVAVFADKFWQRLCRALGRNDLADAPEYATSASRLERQQGLHELLKPIFWRRSTGEWCKILDEADVPNAPVYDYVQMFRDKQVQESGIGVPTDHPELPGLKTVKVPVNFSTIEKTTAGAPPQHGQHTDSVLTSLGYSSGEIEELRRLKCV